MYPLHTLDNSFIVKFRIVVEAIVNVSSIPADIALDDFSFNTGLCPDSSSCDFENGWCGYSQDPLGDFNWQLSDGSLSVKKCSL